MKELDDLWRAWLVGLTDGEGYFGIDKRKKRNPCVSYHCRFQITLRDDDRPILEEIQNTLGIGKIYDISAHPSPGRNGRPVAKFEINAINDCAELVRLFDKYPLRAKKRRDFEVWKDAVAELQLPIALRDPDMLEYCFHQIKEVRRYDEKEELVKPIIVNPQLPIEFKRTRCAINVVLS